MRSEGRRSGPVSPESRMMLRSADVDTDISEKDARIMQRLLDFAITVGRMPKKMLGKLEAHVVGTQIGEIRWSFYGFFGQDKDLAAA